MNPDAPPPNQVNGQPSSLPIASMLAPLTINRTPHFAQKVDCCRRADA